MESKEYAKELAHDLYYDLLDKYIALQERYEEVRTDNKKLRFDYLCYKINSTDTTNKMVQVYKKKIVSMMVHLLHKHKKEFMKAVKEIEGLGNNI